MSLYLLLAIALGAITGVADAPAARPAFAGVVARSSETRARRQTIRASVPLTGRVRQARPGQRRLTFLIRRSDAPLTGGASPRAPSRYC
jgi:hypothetical protein